ncbi:hypothetical protein COLO4_15840 [Corchorus olitorius]|uniref:F-box associated beta-propeller type 1 domain-containing protein n=1 Tax=Corchorus olitorius TaxID=93759 RepID=A0A1R3JL38_9ROSI|nr:hypothetical protein COLO4_15840 [Corchorus olitorius]
MITSPCFIDSHFDRSATDRSKLAIFIEEYSELERKFSIFFLTLNFSDTSSVTKIVEHPITRCGEADPLRWCMGFFMDRLTNIRVPDLLSCCRGLLLLRVKCYPHLLLWNPSTRECKKVPNSPHLPYYHYMSISASALGYDFTLKTHKIVLICDNPLIDRHSYKFLVYNVKTNSWTPIYTDEDHKDLAYYLGTSKTLVNGAPHWLICYENPGDDTERYEIEYFDFATDEFVVIPQPDDPDFRVSFSSTLLDMEGRLCISHYSSGNVTVWVMEEYGVKESWSKTYFSNIYPVCFAKTINVALVRGFDQQVKASWFAFYNGKEKGIELKFLAGKSLANRAFTTFVESLISVETEKVEGVEVVRKTFLYISILFFSIHFFFLVM